MKKILLLCLAITLSNFTAWGQEKLDLKNDTEAQLAKLQNQFEQAKEDTVRFMILMRIADMEQRMGKKEKALQSAQECLDIAQKIDTYKYWHRGYSVIASHYTRIGEPEKSLVYRQKSLEASEKGYPMGLAASHLNLANHYVSTGESKKALAFAKEGMPFAKKYNQIIMLNDLRMCAAGIYSSIYNQKDSALMMYRESISSAKQIKDTVGIFLGYSNMVNLSPNFDSSNAWTTQNIKLAKQIKYLKWVAVSYRKKAYLYRCRGKYNESILYCDTALTYLTKVKESAAIITQADMLLELGELYRLIQNFEKSEQCYEQALLIYQNRQSKEQIAHANVNFATLYDDWGKYDKAIASILEAMRLYKEMNIVKKDFDLQNLLANVYYKQGKVTQALNIHKKNTDPKSDESAISLGNIAKIYLRHHKDSLAIAKKYVDKTLAYANKHHSKQTIITSSLLAARIDSALGDYKSALVHYKTYALYADSLRNKDNTSLVYEYEAKYDNQKLRADKAEADKKILSEKADKQKLKFAVAFVLLVVVAVLVAYWLQRKRKNIAQQLQKVAEEIAQTQTLLAEESRALAEANALRLVQEQEIAQNQEELVATKEARITDLAKERARFLDTMQQMKTYLDKQDYKTMSNIVASQLELVSPSNQAQLQAILVEVNENFPQFIPDLIAAHPDLSSKPKLQDLAVLLAQNTPIADVAQLLFGGIDGTAKNNQIKLRNILGFEAGDTASVRQYLKDLMLKNKSKNTNN